MSIKTNFRVYKIYKIFLYLCVCSLLFQNIVLAQQSKQDSIIMVADSIIISMTNTEYFNMLEKRDNNSLMSKTMTFKRKIDTAGNIIDEPVDEIKYRVYYSLKTIKYPYSLHVISSKNGDFGLAGLVVVLDENLHLDTTARFTLRIAQQFQAFNRCISSKLISDIEAKTIADEYFSSKTKFPYGCLLLMYDAINDVFYWKIEKFKGFQRLTKEEIFINAETSEFIKKRTYREWRSFWEALLHYKDL